MAIFGRALGLPLLAEVTLALSPLDHAEALLLAHGARQVPVPALRRASDPGVGELAALLLRIDALVRHFELAAPTPRPRPARAAASFRGAPATGA